MPKHGECQCGCGGKTSVPIKSCTSLNRVKGVPMRFLPGHSSRGALHPNWKGGRARTGRRDSGYIKMRWAGHLRADSGGYILEHIFIAESAIRKYLPLQAQVHHVDGDGRNNENSNLVICENDAYHKLLHQRARAYKATGNPNMRKCPYCKTYDLPESMQESVRHTFYHSDCHSRYELARYNKL